MSSIRPSAPLIPLTSLVHLTQGPQTGPLHLAQAKPTAGAFRPRFNSRGEPTYVGLPPDGNVRWELGTDRAGRTVLKGPRGSLYVVPEDSAGNGVDGIRRWAVDAFASGALTDYYGSALLDAVHALTSGRIDAPSVKEAGREFLGHLPLVARGPAAGAFRPRYNSRGEPTYVGLPPDGNVRWELGTDRAGRTVLKGPRGSLYGVPGDSARNGVDGIRRWAVDAFASGALTDYYGSALLDAARDLASKKPDAASVTQVIRETQTFLANLPLGGVPLKEVARTTGSVVHTVRTITAPPDTARRADVRRDADAKLTEWTQGRIPTVGRLADHPHDDQAANALRGRLNRHLAGSNSIGITDYKQLFTAREQRRLNTVLAKSRSTSPSRGTPANLPSGDRAPASRTTAKPDKTQRPPAQVRINALDPRFGLAKGKPTGLALPINWAADRVGDFVNLPLFRGPDWRDSTPQQKLFAQERALVALHDLSMAGIPVDDQGGFLLENNRRGGRALAALVASSGQAGDPGGSGYGNVGRVSSQLKQLKHPYRLSDGFIAGFEQAHAQLGTTTAVGAAQTLAAAGSMVTARSQPVPRTQVKRPITSVPPQVRVVGGAPTVPAPQNPGSFGSPNGVPNKIEVSWPRPPVVKAPPRVNRPTLPFNVERHVPTSKLSPRPKPKPPSTLPDANTIDVTPNSVGWEKPPPRRLPSHEMRSRPSIKDTAQVRQAVPMELPTPDTPRLRSMPTRHRRMPNTPTLPQHTPPNPGGEKSSPIAPVNKTPSTTARSVIQRQENAAFLPTLPPAQPLPRLLSEPTTPFRTILPSPANHELPAPAWAQPHPLNYGMPLVSTSRPAQRTDDLSLDATATATVNDLPEAGLRTYFGLKNVDSYHHPVTGHRTSLSPADDVTLALPNFLNIHSDPVTRELVIRDPRGGQAPVSRTLHEAAQAYPGQIRILVTPKVPVPKVVDSARGAVRPPVLTKMGQISITTPIGHMRVRLNFTDIALALDMMSKVPLNEWTTLVTGQPAPAVKAALDHLAARGAEVKIAAAALDLPPLKLGWNRADVIEIPLRTFFDSHFVVRKDVTAPADRRSLEGAPGSFRMPQPSDFERYRFNGTAIAGTNSIRYDGEKISFSMKRVNGLDTSALSPVKARGNVEIHYEVQLKPGDILPRTLVDKLMRQLADPGTYSLEGKNGKFFQQLNFHNDYARIVPSRTGRSRIDWLDWLVSKESQAHQARKMTFIGLGSVLGQRAGPVFSVDPRQIGKGPDSPVDQAIARKLWHVAELSGAMPRRHELVGQTSPLRRLMAEMPSNGPFGIEPTYAPISDVRVKFDDSTGRPQLTVSGLTDSSKSQLPFTETSLLRVTFEDPFTGEASKRVDLLVPRGVLHLVSGEPVSAQNYDAALAWLDQNLPGGHEPRTGIRSLTPESAELMDALRSPQLTAASNNARVLDATSRNELVHLLFGRHRAL